MGQTGRETLMRRRASLFTVEGLTDDEVAASLRTVRHYQLPPHPPFFSSFFLFFSSFSPLSSPFFSLLLLPVLGLSPTVPAALLRSSVRVRFFFRLP